MFYLFYISGKDTNKIGLRTKSCGNDSCNQRKGYSTGVCYKRIYSWVL